MSPRGFCLKLKSLDICINVFAPVEIHLLSQRLMVGWEFTRLSTSSPNICITKDKKYNVKSIKHGLLGRHTDLVSTFNQFLIGLAYYVADTISDATLIHGAAYIEDSECVLVLGDKKSGKSYLTAQKCSKGALSISDDLLIWDGASKITSLGFPIRLRRPVSDELLTMIGPQNLLVGHSLAFVNPTTLRLQVGGRQWEINKVVILRNGAVQNVYKCNHLETLRMKKIKIPYFAANIIVDE